MGVLLVEEKTRQTMSCKTSSVGCPTRRWALALYYVGA